MNIHHSFLYIARTQSAWLNLAKINLYFFFQSFFFNLLIMCLHYYLIWLRYTYLHSTVCTLPAECSMNTLNIIIRVLKPRLNIIMSWHRKQQGYWMKLMKKKKLVKFELVWRKGKSGHWAFVLDKCPFNFRFVVHRCIFKGLIHYFWHSE